MEIITYKGALRGAIFMLMSAQQPGVVKNGLGSGSPEKPWQDYVKELDLNGSALDIKFLIHGSGFFECTLSMDMRFTSKKLMHTDGIEYFVMRPEATLSIPAWNLSSDLALEVLKFYTEVGEWAERICKEFNAHTIISKVD